MDDKCPFCGANIASTSQWLQAYKCQSYWIINKKTFQRSRQCYERQIAQQADEIAILKKELKVKEKV